MLFTDSHLSSPLVFHTIKEEKGIYSCSTCDPFRSNFPWQELHWFDVTGTERGFYNYAVDVNRGIACVAWKDTKLVNLVSTAFPQWMWLPGAIRL